jgi:ABC-type dipeptide/oligopeptide/nickel transport system ATPase component
MTSLNPVFRTGWQVAEPVRLHHGLDRAMDNTYRLMDLTVYGRRETWEDSPPDWPQEVVNANLRTNGRPVAQWSRLEAGRSDELGIAADESGRSVFGKQVRDDGLG